MMPVLPDISCLYFVYPFSFPREQFQERTRRFDDARLPWKDAEVPVWAPARFPEDDLLPHVARFLNPDDGRAATARLWRLHDDAQNVFGFAGRAEWLLRLRRREISFRIGAGGPPGRRLHGRGAQLALFHTGVGFLTVRTRPDAADLDTWMDFLHYFRRADVSSTRVVARRRTGLDPETGAPTYRGFFPLEEPPAEEGRSFAHVIGALLGSGSENAAPDRWWKDLFVPGRLMPYAVLFVEGERTEEVPRILYQLRNCFHRNQGRHPSPEALEPGHPSLLAYAKLQWFLATLEAAGFVAFDPPDDAFFRNNLPQHLCEIYFMVFMLALYQRFTLTLLSDAVAEDWRLEEGDDVHLRENAFERIRHEVLSFTSRGYLAQITHHQPHHRAYRKFREAFHVEELFDEVNSEVREMHQSLTLRQQQRIERLAEDQRVRLDEQAARIQTVSAIAEPRLHRLLSCFKAISGVGVLLNTSFNLRGEPIVRTCEDAFTSFVRSGLDVLVLGDYILKKRCLPMRAVDQPEPLIAPPPRIHAGLFGQIAGAFRVAVVSLGREELLDGVLSEMAPLAPIVLQTPAPGASGYPLALDTLHEASGETVPVSTLAMFDRVVLLIDIPVETAAELAPNIIAPFVECIGSHLLLVDDRGGLCQVDDAFLADWRLAGPRGSASDYEHFWRAQRCRRP